MDFSKFTNAGAYKPNAIELIPAGVLLLVRLDYKPGGLDLPGTPPELLSRALTASKSSDVLYLNAEFTVMTGPYRGRKIFEMFSLHGGELNEDGESKAGIIAMGKIREIIDAARFISTKDESPEAMAKRALPKGIPDLKGMQFLVKAGFAKGNNGYADKNKLGVIVGVDHKDFTTDMNALNNVTVPGTAPKPAVAAPSWGAPAAPAVAPAAPITVAAPATAPFGAQATPAVAPVAPAPAAPPPPPADASAVPAWFTGAPTA